MPQETVGFVNLEWTCKRCGSKNPGTTKICASCGNVMSETDKFELPTQQELIKDEAVIAKAERGPDVTCKYCGARNAADAKNCSQCSADLTEATARQAGGVLGAFSAEKKPDVKCPYCGAMNPATALKCSNCAGSLAQRPVDQAKAPPAIPAKANRVPLFVGIGVLVVAVIVCGLLFFRTSDTLAAVQSVQWQRAIKIMEERPVEHETWRDQIPGGASLGSCELKVRGTQDEPAPNAEKVCGTPYTVDTGSGVGKVVQDCQYEVKDDWCAYTRLEWTVIDSVVAQGAGANPQWPAVNLRADQREGDREETYVVFFTSDDKEYQLPVSSAGDLAKYVVGSRWKLKVNALGGVVGAEPAQ